MYWERMMRDGRERGQDQALVEFSWGAFTKGGTGGGAKKNKPEVRISAGMQPSNRLMRREGS